jgi:SAM-dependent methyltransferase
LKIHNKYSSQFYPDNKFDLITMLQVIEHLSNPVSVIHDVKRILKPGGYFYVACPNFESISFKLFGKYHRHVSTFGHLNLFSPETLSKIICDNGFEIVDIETYNADVKLHDLIYYYFLRRKFSHRYSGYNPFTFALLEFIGKPVVSFYERYYVKKRNLGSYNRAIFKLKS